jgi:hypothetical protein
MVAKPVQFEKVLALALQLSKTDRERLLERVASTLEQDVAASAAPTQSEADIPPTWTKEELQALKNQPAMTLAEVAEWLRSTPPPEPWGDLRDDEDAAEYIHRMRRKTWSTPEDALPGDDE